MIIASWRAANALMIYLPLDGTGWTCVGCLIKRSSIHFILTEFSRYDVKGFLLKSKFLWIISTLKMYKLWWSHYWLLPRASTTSIKKMTTHNQCLLIQWAKHWLCYTAPGGQTLQHSPSAGLGGKGSGHVGTWHSTVSQSIACIEVKKKVKQTLLW